MGSWKGFDCLVMILLACGFAACQRFPQAWYRQQPDSVRQPSSRTGWGSVRGLPEFSRQLSTSSLSPISVMCQEAQMVVTVQKDLYGTGKLIKAADLTLGTPPCKFSSEDGVSVVFQNNLQDCGSQSQMDANYVIYSTSLSYKPSASRNSPIVRTNSATVSIQCYYPRHGNVSSDAIKPTWLPFSSTVSSEEKLSFSLQLMTEDWSQTRDSIFFSLGDSFHIEASVDIQNHLPMRVSVDSCRAVTSDDPNSIPQYDLIAYNGCLVDSKLEDSASTFVSRPQPNRLQFLIDSFQFIGALDYTVYIFCTLKAVPLTQAPDPTNKACSFSKSSNTWSAVEGAANICSCCDSGNCDVTSQARRLRPGPRRQWKRDNEAVEQSEQEVQVKALGPLILMAPPQNTEALAVQTDSREQEVKPWMAAAVGSLWLVVAIAAVLTWKLRAKSHVTNLQ